MVDTIKDAERHTHASGTPAAFRCGATVGRLDLEGAPTCPVCRRALGLMDPGGQRDPKPENLDPGIRRTVAWLRERGFETTDSGDGVSKAEAIAEGEALETPHVFIVSTPARMNEEAERLLAALSRFGVVVGSAEIQATYDPSDGSGAILLCGIDDARLFDKR